MTKHIVFVWELGAGLGHVAGLKPLAKALMNAGFKVSLISNNIHSAADTLADLPIDIYQAPIFRNMPEKRPATYSYAEILLELGYQSTQELWPVSYKLQGRGFHLHKQ